MTYPSSEHVSLTVYLGPNRSKLRRSDAENPAWGGLAHGDDDTTRINREALAKILGVVRSGLVRERATGRKTVEYRPFYCSLWGDVPRTTLCGPVAV